MYKHSVSLESTKCTGCTTCLKHCPTEAIRIRDNKAVIDPNKCIDCGECIRVCQNNAKFTVCDKLDDIKGYRWKIALPAPTLLGQFSNVEDVKLIYEGLYDLGFDDIFEVSYAAEIISAYTKKYMKKAEHKTPVISSACPAIVRLIYLRFPTLYEHLLPIMAPVELAAKMARTEAKRKHPNLLYEDIAVVLISPCAAKVSYAKNPTDNFKSNIDFTVGMNEIYFKLVNNMPKELDKFKQLSSTMLGIGWALSGGESVGAMRSRYIAADGIESSISILSEIEKGKLTDLDFVELLACPGGCVGGVLTVENPYIAKTRIQSLAKQVPYSKSNARMSDNYLDADDVDFSMAPVEAAIPMLGRNFKESLKMMSEVKNIQKTLPNIDCAVCGAPTCKAFAEDMVKGEAVINDCIFVKCKELENRLKEVEGNEC